MASAWGLSWGRAWGNAWGRITSASNVAPSGWFGTFDRARPTKEQIRKQRERLGILEPETLSVVQKKKQAKPDSSEFWELHALEHLLRQELDQLREYLDAWDAYQKHLAAESQRLAEIALLKAKTRERDIAFIMAMLA